MALKNWYKIRENNTLIVYELQKQNTNILLYVQYKQVELGWWVILQEYEFEKLSRFFKQKSAAIEYEKFIMNRY